MSEDKGLALQIKKRFETLKGDRKNWDNHWREVADYVIPRKDDVYKTRRSVTGEKKSNKSFLFDSTAIHANELLASALHSMLTNPSLNWFELTTGVPEIDRLDDVRLWLQRTAETMHQTLNNSNFQTEIHEVYLDLGSFGTGLIQIEEDPERLLRFRARPVYDGYIQENSKGVVDTIFREEWMSLRNIVDKFGKEKLNEKLLRELDKNPDSKKHIIHGVFPRKNLNNKKIGPKNMPYASVYSLSEESIVLEESGFNEFPYLVPRWTKISGEVYGRSPAIKSLPDIKMVNAMMETTLRSGQKITDPPLLVPDDGFMLPLNLRPGGISYYRAGTPDQVIPLQTGGRIDFGFQLLERIRTSIREAFFIDQLQLNVGPQMTATEVSQRTEEKLRLLAPILARQHDELLRPLIDRVFGIMLRAEALPPIPEVLSEQEINVRYSSQVAKAQRASDAQNINRFVQLATPFFQVDPTVMDNLNPDEAVRHIGHMFSIPQELFRDQDEVESLREQRQEQEAQQAQQEAQLAQAEAIGKAGPTLLDAQTQGVI